MDACTAFLDVLRLCFFRKLDLALHGKTDIISYSLGLAPKAILRGAYLEFVPFLCGTPNPAWHVHRRESDVVTHTPGALLHPSKFP